MYYHTIPGILQQDGIKKEQETSRNIADHGASQRRHLSQLLPNPKLAMSSSFSLSHTLLGMLGLVLPFYFIFLFYSSLNCH